MPPGHQRNAGVEAQGDSHVGHSATDARTCPNWYRFALVVSKTHSETLV
ncbi:MAG: hypothetical protein QOK33_609, partial [Mycobacterium sp.]|nr:hypothetical protein [Mycobacterium sp.]